MMMAICRGRFSGGTSAAGREFDPPADGGSGVVVTAGY
jgi:hypothetical protein